MDQATAKKELQELIKREDLKNKTCIDCGNPNPQWASVSFAIFICLQCAGLHRGFGVHISFVRSVSMDSWQKEQIERMKIGGNEPFRQFMQSYVPADQGGYTEGMAIYDKYHCWAASQYKEKLNATLEGKSFTPSSPPPDFGTPRSGSESPSLGSSAQGLRKSRTSQRNATGSNLRQNSASPASFTNSPTLGGSNSQELKISESQKAANDAYFERLGSANNSRSADLAPSQGGRYQGFGNTPSPSQGSQNPSYGLSSAAVPSFSELQENPSAALSKGWSLFSAAISGATRAVSENVIQPGLEKARDPNLHASVRGYVGEASKRVGAVSAAANQTIKAQLGVDVAENVGGWMDTVKDRAGVSRDYEGYGALNAQGGHDDDDWKKYDDDNFYNDFEDGHHKDEQQNAFSSSSTTSTATAAANPSKASTTTPAAKKADDWDEWDNF
ncbi:ArfGap-domain-containing protein [Schizopora paradoxa]|uniref:ArfGap-domain-containing protein n=1 Tax=Schizopora paradoxa TaxID=27342 RepID=A0A0H2S2D3_9AGAM|nr:ArfGap-domain-containing protein [Schizopora paradoxa]